MIRRVFIFGLACLLSFSFMMLKVDAAPKKILGPYLWMIAKTAGGQGGAGSTNIDSLDNASGGKVTEEKVAKNGVREGDEVGNYEWTYGTLADDGDINVLVNRVGLEPGALDDITSYALIVLKTRRAQNKVDMGVSSDDSVKIWLNGEVVHTNGVNRGRGGAGSFLDHLTVDLKKGNNLFMIKISERAGGWGMHFGVDGDYDVSEVDDVFPVKPVDKLTTQWAQIKNFR